MKNRGLLGLSVVLILAFSLSACASLGDVTDLGNKFMSALSTGDNATSYQMLHPEIHNEVGGEAGWADWTSIRNFEKWKFTNTSVENNTAELQGTAELNGETYDVFLCLIRWMRTGSLPASASSN